MLGLWERDVLELFIYEESEGKEQGETVKYQEFNLSPEGAWWSQAFENVHQMLKSCQIESTYPVKTCSEITQEGWRAALSVPLRSLAVKFDINTVRINANAILGDGDSKQFLSFTKLPGNNPNFHQPSAFPKINLINKK